MDRLLFVITGSAGERNQGKRLDGLIAENYAHGAARVVPSTTRQPMPDEERGVDFHFPSIELFQHQKAQGGLIEYAAYKGHHYGINLILLRRQFDFSRLLFVDTNQCGVDQLTGALNKVCRLHACIVPLGGIDQIERELKQLLV